MPAESGHGSDDVIPAYNLVQSHSPQGTSEEIENTRNSGSGFNSGSDDDLPSLDELLKASKRAVETTPLTMADEEGQGCERDGGHIFNEQVGEEAFGKSAAMSKS